MGPVLSAIVLKIIEEYMRVTIPYGYDCYGLLLVAGILFLPKGLVGCEKVEVLKLENIKKSFGGVKAVDGLSFSVQEGEILGIIGPNGAGKSTVFNLICGLIPLDAGRIVFRRRYYLSSPA